MIEQLKLAKLPDRTPVKIIIAVSPDLNRQLLAYAQAYKAVYLDNEETEPIAELIPYMLQSFLESDRHFSRVLKEQSGRTNGRTSRSDS